MFKYVPKIKKDKKAILEAKKPIKVDFKRIELEDPYQYNFRPAEKVVRLSNESLGVNEKISEKRNNLMNRAFRRRIIHGNVKSMDSEQLNQLGSIGSLGSGSDSNR